MKKANQFFLISTIFCWSIIIGAVVYSHIAYFPSLVFHLPESSILANGPYKINDELFWKLIHPITILFTSLSLYFNWKNIEVRKSITIALLIYVLALIATFTFFVPELITFFNSSSNNSLLKPEWLARGERWLYLSWLRGCLMFIGFFLLLSALKKS